MDNEDNHVLIRKGYAFSVILADMMRYRYGEHMEDTIMRRHCEVLMQTKEQG